MKTRITTVMNRIFSWLPFFGKNNSDNLEGMKVDQQEDAEDTISTQIETYSADAPLKDPKDDQFGRWPFAQRIAQTIASRKDPSSLVVAIFGEWGEGKTTVLNFIRRELEEQENIIPLSFNPWRSPSEPELLLGFYQSLADALGKRLPTKKEQLGQWLEYLVAPASLAGRADTVKELLARQTDGMRP